MKYKKYFSKAYPILIYILKIHLLALVILSILRLILLLTNLENAESVEPTYIINAFQLGFFFDNIGVSIITVFPLLATFALSFFKSIKDFVRKLFNLYYIVAYTVLFGFSIANIPYFNYFFRHLDVGILDWLSHDTEGFGMIFTESGYYKYYILFFVIIALFIWAVISFSKKWSNTNNSDRDKNNNIGIKFV